MALYKFKDFYLLIASVLILILGLIVPKLVKFFNHPNFVFINIIDKKGLIYKNSDSLHVSGNKSILLNHKNYSNLKTYEYEKFIVGPKSELTIDLGLNRRVSVSENTVFSISKNSGDIIIFVNRGNVTSISNNVKIVNKNKTNTILANSLIKPSPYKDISIPNYVNNVDTLVSITKSDLTHSRHESTAISNVQHANSNQNKIYSMINDRIKRQKSRFARCYYQLYEKSEKLSGKVNISFILNSLGKVENLNLSSKEFNGNTVFYKCISDTLKRTDFLPFNGTSVQAMFPLKFESVMK